MGDFVLEINGEEVGRLPFTSKTDNVITFENLDIVHDENVFGAG